MHNNKQKSLFFLGLIFILVLSILIVNMGSVVQKSTRYYDGDDLKVMIQYSGSLDQVSQIQIAGTGSSGLDKLGWLTTQVKTRKISRNNGREVKEFGLTDEYGQMYRFRLYTDLGTATLDTINSSGKVVKTWDLNMNRSVKSNLDGDAALVFDGDFAVKFDYNKKTKLMTDIQFSVDKGRKFYSKYDVYGVEDYVEREHVGKLYTVKDSDEKLYTIFYSESCDYLLIHSGIDLSASEITLYLKGSKGY